MPELPDVTVYIEALEQRVLHRDLNVIRLRSPFLLRTAHPKLESCHGQQVLRLSRMGKRLVFELTGSRYLALHLMIAGRLHFKPVGAAIPQRNGLCAFDFDSGTLLLTEAGTQRRAALHVFDTARALAQLDRGGLEILTASFEEFAEAVQRENHTLKRTLTDPRLLSGIGNAYSDEILHRARLSPVTLSTRLGNTELRQLFEACKEVLEQWTSRLRATAGTGFPEKVTAFREGMAVHGRFRKPCPRCGTAVQRIVYAKSETNYCPTCQTDGKLLADRALSRLLKSDWPKTATALEERLVRK